MWNPGRIASIAVVVGLLAATTAAPAAPPREQVTWDHEGLARLPAALLAAAAQGKPVLVGLSGSPT